MLLLIVSPPFTGERLERGDPTNKPQQPKKSKPQHPRTSQAEMTPNAAPVLEFHLMIKTYLFRWEMHAPH